MEEADKVRSKPRRPYRGGCGCGGGGFLLVLTLGIALSLFSVDIGIGGSVRVPFTSSNITIAGSIGAKDKAVDALPSYVRNRLGSNQDFLNNSATLTIGPGEGASLLVIGRQEGAPGIDLYLVGR